MRFYRMKFESGRSDGLHSRIVYVNNIRLII